MGSGFINFLLCLAGAGVSLQSLPLKSLFCLRLRRKVGRCYACGTEGSKDCGVLDSWWDL